MAEQDVDKIVMEAFFNSCKGGTFVEVGAARPDFLSISKLYRDHDWRIIAIEPNPEFCQLHRANGFEVLEYACGQSNEDNVDFFVVDSMGADYLGGNVQYESFSSLGIRGEYAKLHKTVDTKVKKIKVKMRTLDRILEEHAPDISLVDILSIDVEGWELEVMKGLSFNVYRPKVLIIENLFDDASYQQFLLEQGYKLWKHLAPNEVYVRTTDDRND